MTSPTPITGSARTLLLVAAVIVSIESVGYLALAGLGLLDDRSTEIASTIGAAALIAGYGIGQLVAVRLLLQGRAGARSPLVVTQVLQALVATSLRDQPTLALCIGGAAVAVLACLLAPPVTRALARPID